MNRGYLLVVFLLLMTFSILLTGCSKLPINTEKTTLNVGIPTFGNESLDPSSEDGAVQAYYRHMYDSLLGSDANGTVRTSDSILKDWSFSESGLSLKINLDKNLKWHDKQKINSKEIAYSLEQHFRLNAACATCGKFGENIQGFTFPSNDKLEISFVEPDYLFLNTIGPSTEDIILVKSSEDNFDTSNTSKSVPIEPVGSGPWSFTKRDKGLEIIFEKNYDYWNDDRKANHDRLNLFHIPDDETRSAMLSSGQLDMAPVNGTDIKMLKQKGLTIGGPKYVVETTLRFCMSYDKDYLTSKQAFRKALTLSLNIDDIIEDIYPSEMVSRANGSSMFTPITQGHIPDLPPYGYDPSSAKKSLEQVGYENEPVYLLSIPIYERTEMLRQDEYYDQVNERIVNAWKKIGINANLVPSNYGEVKTRYFNQESENFEDLKPAPIFHGGHISKPGGIMNSLRRYLTNLDQGGLQSYHSPQIGTNVYDDLHKFDNLADRTKRLEEINRELYEEYWAVPIVWRHEAWGIGNDIITWNPANGTTSDLRFDTVISSN